MNNYFNKLNLIFHAIVGLPLAAFIYLYLEIDKRGRQGVMKDPELSEILIYILPTLAIVTAGLAFLQYRRAIPKVKEIADFRQKLDAFSQALIQKYALLEFSSIISVVGIYLTADVIYIALYLFMLLFLSLHRPTVYRIVRDLKLKGEEKEIVLHKKDLPE